MKQAIQIASIYTMLLSLFLLVEGIWGLFSPLVFGILTTNTLHASIHIVLGITGIWLGAAEKPRGFCIFTGSILIIVGILRFIKGPDQVVVDLLRVNYAVAAVNIVIGALSLIMAMITRPAHNHQHFKMPDTARQHHHQ